MIQFFRRCQNNGCEVLQLNYLLSKQPPTFLYEIIISKREKNPTKIYENYKMGKLFLPMLSSLLWTAYHVKIIRYQNNHLINAVILVYNSFRWNRPNFWANLHKMRGVLKVGAKCKSRLNSIRNVGHCARYLVPLVSYQYPAPSVSVPDLIMISCSCRRNIIHSIVINFNKQTFMFQDN